jgi:hypothetical protein
LIEYVQDYARTYAAACLEAARAPAVRQPVAQQWWFGDWPATQPQADPPPSAAAPTDAQILEIAKHWLVTGENQRREMGYCYRSIGETTNVRESHLIEFARAVLAAAPAVQGLSDAEDAERYRKLAASNWYIGPAGFYCDEAGGMNDYADMNNGREALDAAVDALPPVNAARALKG